LVIPSHAQVAPRRVTRSAGVPAPICCCAPQA